MGFWKQHGTGWATAWHIRESVPQIPLEVAYDKTPGVVLREMSIILACALGLAFAVNTFLAALHIG